MSFLRTEAFLAYLAAWAVVVITAAWSAFRCKDKTAMLITAPVIVGSLLQGAALWTATLTIPDGPLRPARFELIGALVLAPAGAALFAWAMRSAQSGLVTTGAYSRLRHPTYLAFLLLLAATGMLASAGLKLIGSCVLYAVGTELRIAAEESELSGKFAYEEYKSRTRWRYLPGIR